MLFVYQKAGGNQPVLYREKIEWSFDSILRRIADELGVNAENARALYCSYRSGELSESAARGLKKVIQPVVEALTNEIERAKVGGFVYIDAPHPLPFASPFKHKGATFEELPVNEILGEVGLAPDRVMSEQASVASFRRLAPFLEAYFAKSTSDINQKLRRRLHWLAD
jgi:hypothetical protein